MSGIDARMVLFPCGRALCPGTVLGTGYSEPIPVLGFGRPSSYRAGLFHRLVNVLYPYLPKRGATELSKHKRVSRKSTRLRFRC